VLNRLRSGPPANLLKNRLAPGAIGALHAHLDQLVAFQTAVDFRKHRGRQPAPRSARPGRVRARAPSARAAGRVIVCASKGFRLRNSIICSAADALRALDGVRMEISW